MTEEFLHYLWKFRLLNSELQTRSGETLTIIHPGEHNRDGGPDFLNARLQIGDTTWAGNVEIHINEDDWIRHSHHLDKAYDNVILHVVHEESDQMVKVFAKEIPTLILKDNYSASLYDRYREFTGNRSWIPCERLISRSDAFYFEQWSPSLLIERLESRSEQWEKTLETNKYDWTETLHQSMARSFGLKINALPFELLAKSLPLKTILRYQKDPFVLESLAFGQAGLLDREFTEEYPLSLQKEYSFLSAKHSLKSIDASLWKYLRLRPSAFPTVRIAQWSRLLQHADRLLSSVLECIGTEELTKILSVGTSGYWDNHFLFGRITTPQPKFLGDASIHLIILNCVAPFLYFYGKQKGLVEYREKAVTLAEQLPGEKNAIIQNWKTLGFPADNALKTQALIQLKSAYCDRKRCLECRIGSKLLVRGEW